MNERSDHDLSAAEADRLEALLRRTADRVPVDPHPTLPADTTVRPLPTRAPRRRWLAAAAAVVLVAAVGGAWWLVAEDGQRVDSGPADPTSVTVAPEVLEQTGVWRLPEGLDDTRVVDAQRSNVVPELLFAFDSDDPERWVAIGRYGLRPSLPSDDVVRQPVADGVYLVEWGADDADWTGYEVRVDNGMGTGDSPMMTVITESVERGQVVDMVRSTFPDRASLLESDQVLVALGSIDLPDGLEPGWDEVDLASTFGEPAPGSPVLTGLELTLVDDADREIVVSLGETATNGTALQLTTEVVSAIMTSNQGDGQPGAVVYRMHPRPDLGTDVLELTYGVGDEHDEDLGSILVVTDDGVVISAMRAVLASAGADGGPDGGPDATPLTEAEQLRIINSLRATTEADFRAQLERLGATYGDPNRPGG